MIASLMMLAVAALVIPTLAAELHTPAAEHENALGAACAVLLLIVFFFSLPFSLSSDPDRTVRQAEKNRSRRTTRGHCGSRSPCWSWRRSARRWCPSGS